MNYILGLDLAKRSDFTAISILRRTAVFDARGQMERDKKGDILPRFACVHLERHRGMHYPDIVTRTMDLLGTPEVGERPILVLDQTGVGSPVYDMFRDKNVSNYTIVGVTSTGGQTWSVVGPRQMNVSKVLMVSAMQVAFQSGRLKISPKLPLAEVVKKELISYRVKITLSANEQYMARDSDHDDCVISLMLPIYLATSIIGRGLMPSLERDELEETQEELLTRLRAERDERDRVDKQRAEDWQAICRGEETKQQKAIKAKELEEQAWREKRKHQTEADRVEWEDISDRVDIQRPAWFAPDREQAASVPFAPEPDHPITDAFQVVTDHRKSLGAGS